MQQATLQHQHIEFKKERNFSEKINVTFAFLSQNFRPLAKNLLLVAGPFSLLGGLLYGWYQSFILGGAFGQENPFGMPFAIPSVIVSLAGMIIFTLMAGTMVTAVVLRHIKMYIEEGHCNISTPYMWQTIWKDFFNVLGTSVFIMVGVFGVGMAIFIPLGILGVGSQNFFLIALTMFVMMIAMFFVLPALTLLYPIRNIEKKDVFSSVSRMFRIISGKWLSTLGIVVVSVIIQSIIAVIFAVPMYIIMALKFLHTEGAITEVEDSGSLYQIMFTLSSGFSMLGTYTLYSILFIAITFQYYSLVERKDSSGLLERMESFGKQKQDPDDYAEQY